MVVSSDLSDSRVPVLPAATFFLALPNHGLVLQLPWSSAPLPVLVAAPYKKRLQELLKSDEIVFKDSALNLLSSPDYPGTWHWGGSILGP